MSVTKITLQNYADEVSRSEKPVLIDFYADWCGPCKMTAPELEAFSHEYDDVKVCKINVDESADLAAMYGRLTATTAAMASAAMLCFIFVFFMVSSFSFLVEATLQAVSLREHISA